VSPNTERALIVIASVIAVLLVVVLVILLTDDDTTVAGGTTSSSAAGSTSSTAAPATTSPATTGPTSSSSSSSTSSTTSSSTSTTAAPSGACSGLPSVTIPGPEPGVTFAAGDFDGDGTADQLIGYQDASGVWWVQFALDYGYATQTAVPGPVEALGATNFGGGQDVGYAIVDRGASTQIVGFFFLPGCDLFEATVGAGVARFPLGGGVTHLDGLRCTADGFTTTSATTSDGSSWEYTTTDYAWVPGLLEFQSTASSIAILNSPADDDTIFASGDFVCPDTSL